MARVLISGITGFVGSHVARRLVEIGYDVHGIVRPGSSHKYFDDSAQRITLHIFDGGFSSLTHALQSHPDIVIHLASVFVAEHSTEDVLRLVESNVLFGTMLLEAMKESHCWKIVNTGTSWQNFRGDNYMPVNLYAATKQAFEDILLYYVDAEKFSAITLRLFDTYGEGDERNKLYQQLKRSAATGQSLSMSPGEQELDLLHIRRVVTAYEIATNKLLSKSISGHEVYVVSNQERKSLRKVVAEFEKEFGTHLNVKWGEREYRRREVMKPWTGGRNILNEGEEERR